MLQLERRYISSEVEVRAKGSDFFVEGYAAVFGRRSADLGGFVEVVERTAFTKTVQEADVRALMNHDPNRVLGRTKSGTLELSTDDSGLYYRALLPAGVSYANDLKILLDRRDISQSSFGFWAINDDWDYTESNYPQRHLNEVGLVDVSPVTYPAYEDSTSALGRSLALAGLAKRCGREVCDLGDAEAIKNAIAALGRDKAETEEPSAEDTPVDSETLTRQEWARRELAREDLAPERFKWSA